jgi:predicted lactoylglutathione lyase
MTDTAAVINATNLGSSITCKDLEASIRFYRDAIGFAVARTFENEGKVVAAVVAAGNCHIVLNQDDGSRDRVSTCRSTSRALPMWTRLLCGSRPRVERC